MLERKRNPLLLGEIWFSDEKLFTCAPKSRRVRCEEWVCRSAILGGARSVRVALASLPPPVIRGAYPILAPLVPDLRVRPFSRTARFKVLRTSGRKYLKVYGSATCQRTSLYAACSRKRRA